MGTHLEVEQDANVSSEISENWKEKSKGFDDIILCKYKNENVE